jgi:hypothetical protein
MKKFCTQATTIVHEGQATNVSEFEVISTSSFNADFVITSCMLVFHYQADSLTAI